MQQPLSESLERLISGETPAEAPEPTAPEVQSFSTCSTKHNLVVTPVPNYACGAQRTLVHEPVAVCPHRAASFYV